MSEMQEQITKKLIDAMGSFPSEDKTYLCGFIDGMAASSICDKKEAQANADKAQ